MKVNTSIIVTALAASGLLLGGGLTLASAAQAGRDQSTPTTGVLLASNSVASGSVQIAEAGAGASGCKEHQEKCWQEHLERVQAEERRALEAEQKGVQMEQRGIEMEQRGVEEEQKAQEEEERLWWERWRQEHETGDGAQ